MPIGATTWKQSSPGGMSHLVHLCGGTSSFFCPIPYCVFFPDSALHWQIQFAVYSNGQKARLKSGPNNYLTKMHFAQESSEQYTPMKRHLDQAKNRPGICKVKQQRNLPYSKQHSKVWTSEVVVSQQTWQSNTSHLVSLYMAHRQPSQTLPSCISAQKMFSLRPD